MAAMFHRSWALLHAIKKFLTRELNNGKMEPKTCDDTRFVSFRKLVEKFVDEMCQMFPLLDTQFCRLGAHRDQAFDMTSNNCCWLCGRLDHVRADCQVPRNELPQGREAYTTDRHRQRS